MKTYKAGIEIFYEKYLSEGSLAVSWAELNEIYACSAPLVPAHRARAREVDSCHFDVIRDNAIRFNVPGDVTYPCLYVNVLDREALVAAAMVAIPSK